MHPEDTPVTPPPKATVAKEVTREIAVDSLSMDWIDGKQVVEARITGLSSAQALDFAQAFTEFLTSSLRSYAAVEKFGPTKER